MTIHSTDPFATPPSQRSPARRLRGRLPAPVTLWTALGSDGPTGLTVSSVLVADGDPGRVLGLLDPESPLVAAVEHSGRFAVSVLGSGHRRLADRFAGLLPAPGGPFADAGRAETGSADAGRAETGSADAGRAETGSADAGRAETGSAGLGWTETSFGPVPVDVADWAGCRLESIRPLGWGVLVEGILDQLRLAEQADPLVHARGRYRELCEP